MKTSTLNLYVVQWDNGHASGIFQHEIFTRKKAAEKWAIAWKREMVNADEDRKAAIEAYSWEIVQCPLFVERNFEWPGHSWSVYTKQEPPRTSIFTECPFKHVVPAAISWLKKEFAKHSSDYLRQSSITL